MVILIVKNFTVVHLEAGNSFIHFSDSFKRATAHGVTAESEVTVGEYMPQSRLFSWPTSSLVKV